MSFYFHEDRKLYFEHQRLNTLHYVIPFIEQGMEIPGNANVLEIGCGEGGVLKAFLDRGCKGYGVELSETKYEQARENLKDELHSGQATIIQKDIYDVDFEQELGNDFDLIVLKDVIEHIHDHQQLIHRLKSFLSKNGHIYFGFPPWYMPFGGHQQICRNKVLSLFPYYHLLPRPLYKFLLTKAGERQSTVDELLDIKTTGLSLEHFEHLARKEDYRIVNKKLYLINPIYHYKFGLKPLGQLPVVRNLPYVRDFLTTCGYYLIRRNDSRS